MVTIKDIAKELGISYSTVSLALRNSPKANKDTIQLVKETADRMGYKPNSVARSLVLQKSILVAMITPDISSPFYARIVEGAEAACREQGFNMLICNTNWDTKWEEQHLNLILERQIDGAVISPCNVKNPRLEKILTEDLPIAFVSSRYPHKDMKNQIFVGADNEGGGLMAARHLMEKPRQAVGIIGGSVNSESLVHRMKGYRKGLKEAGLEDDHIHFYAGEFSQESGYENTLRILKEHPETDGLICLNDLVALGALKAAKESNRQVPLDLGVIGYDDTYLASLEPISLTSVYQPKYQMGYRAMNHLLARLQSGGSSSESCEILPCSLSKRSSV